MKTRWLIPILILAVMALVAFGCKKEETNATSTTATSATSSSDTTGVVSTVGTAAPTTGASTLDPADKDFITKAAIGGMFEVTAGQLASAKATNPDVKAFGDRMVLDHGKANDELKQLATTKGVALPTELDAEHKKTMDSLSSKTGKEFDKAYISDMVKDHEQDVAEFEKQAKNAKDQDLKAWATKTLPTLQAHLKMARATAAKVK